MKPSKILILPRLFAIALSSDNALAADDESITVGADLEYRSRYLFSGFPISNGSVIQARLALAYNGFTFNALTNYDAGTDEFDEADVYADYYFQHNETIGVYVGAANYNFKNFTEQGEWDSTYEFYAGISFNLPGNPNLEYARDFSLSNGGQIVHLSFSHEVPVGDVAVTGAGGIVYNDNYYRLGSNLSHIDMSISIKAQLGRFTLTPKVAYQKAIANDFENFWVGIVTLHRDF